MYSTRAFARLAGVTVKTLRYYEQRGLHTLEALKTRAKWPAGMRQYIASLYETTPEAFERVAAFIEANPA